MGFLKNISVNIFQKLKKRYRVGNLFAFIKMNNKCIMLRKDIKKYTFNLDFI